MHCKTVPGIYYPCPAPNICTPQCSNGAASEPHQSGASLPFCPSEFQPADQARCAEVCLWEVFLVPPWARPVLNTEASISSTVHLIKSHVVQSHTQKSIINCTPGISHQQKDSLDNLTILSLMLWFLRTVQGKKFLLGWKDGRHREKIIKHLFKSLDFVYLPPP